MHRASDVTSKMVSAGLRHAASSNNASRGGAGNTNTTVSSPFLSRCDEGKEYTRTIFFFFFVSLVF